ncbi:head decoration protein [Nocardia terpenica]|uniref:K structural protein n=1 Tax=Nocardia terpenica TaxID=455432 RepID=A0A291RTA9_9NOCA|nr:head decoration protein [Nocardia terpenica]ATL70776.1 K structural protein [Nocardia terpenica]
MTSITVRTIGTFVGENRSWLQSDHGAGPNEMPGITLDISKFTFGTHYPTGFLKSGIVLGKVTTSGLFGPYDPAATDGRENPAGILFSSLPVQGNTRIGAAMMVHGFVDAAKLPANNGLDANARTKLPLIVFTN